MAKEERPSLDSESPSEDSNDFLLGEAKNHGQKKRQGYRKGLVIALTTLNIAVFVLTCVVWTDINSRFCKPLDAQKEVSYYSPIFDKDVSIDLDESVKNHTLWGDDENTSIYIRDPSPEVDLAWNHIAADSSPIITINKAEAIQLGRDPDVIVKAPEDWGFGNDAYPAQIDAFHEIHCLNMLRKEMWWDHYFRPRFGDPSNADYLHVRHKRHCLRIILRTLMCHADVDIVTHNWRRGSYRPIADFNNPRKCRNFEGLLEWNNAHAVQDDMEKWRTIKRPTKAVILPKPTPNLYTSEDSQEWINGV